MPGGLAIPWPPDARTVLVLLVTLALVLTAIIVRIIFHSRSTAAEMERRRRMALTTIGKMGDATITDGDDNVLIYSYLVRGVEYIASQDVSSLRELLPGDASTLAGPVLVKYDPRNPANSIIISEQWSGLGIVHRALNMKTLIKERKKS